MAWVGIVIIIALFEFFGFGLAVAKARGRYGCPAPATSGHEMFERYFRVQMNTLEQLVVFIPAIVLFAWVFDPRWAAAIGVVWILGRLVYFRSYVRDPRSRALGFAMTALPSLGMLAAALVGLVAGLIRSAN
ncbi:MAG: MAPEG family protein [Pseudomonadota bacterium]|nr:MAPEG family protein [Pseudomonadota bacterium]